MESVAFSNGMCRCCSSEGIFKDIYSKYSWMGEEECYSQMLKDCFDVQLQSLSEDGDRNKSGICELCITQLRNAVNFKKQVLHTEQQFKRHLQTLPLGKTEIKQEYTKDDATLESENNMSDVEFSEPDGGQVKTEKVEVKPTKTRKKAAATKAKTSRARKVKHDAAGESSTERTENAAPKRKGRKRTVYDSATPERVEHRTNLTTILQHSNASPFKDKTQKGFACLYCSKYFQHIDELRVHTAQNAEKSKIHKIIDYKLSYNPIKVDITNLRCLICDTSMRDLNDLKDHLASIHQKTIHKNIKDIILPFRLNDGTNYVCVVCSDVHISFKNLYHHMSSHYRNYCCNDCGTGYITIAAMRKHRKTHYQGNFPCNYCDKMFISESKRRNHEKGVHTGGWWRNKCPHCPEIFVSYYDRSEHLVRVHNKAPVIYPCNACNKIYKKKFELNRHIKHHHLQQKNYLCDICNAKFFSKRGMIDHMSRHIGGESYACDVCGKCFSRSRTLKEHMKGHDDTNRFQCEICKKTFMQKSSLKCHMRLHQDDLEIFKEFDDVKHLIDNRDLTLKEIAAENKKKAEKQN